MANGRPWSPAELSTLRRMARASYSDVEIGKHIQRHPKCVGTKRRELRIDPGQSPVVRAIVARLNLRHFRARIAA